MGGGVVAINSAVMLDTANGVLVSAIFLGARTIVDTIGCAIIGGVYCTSISLSKS